MTISEMVERAHDNALAKGFYVDIAAVEVVEALHILQDRSILRRNAIATRLALISSEVGEAIEALRNEDLNGFNEELADVAIRLGDLCGFLGVDLESEVEKKMKKNGKREHRHGKAF